MATKRCKSIHKRVFTKKFLSNASRCLSNVPQSAPQVAALSTNRQKFLFQRKHSLFKLWKQTEGLECLIRVDFRRRTTMGFNDEVTILKKRVTICTDKKIGSFRTKKIPNSYVSRGQREMSSHGRPSSKWVRSGELDPISSRFSPDSHTGILVW